MRTIAVNRQKVPMRSTGRKSQDEDGFQSGHPRRRYGELSRGQPVLSPRKQV